jgi:large subunit ribosomal protein L25
MYGHGTAPIHITLPGHDAMMALKNPNALLTIVLDGTEQLALAKDVQRDPIKPVIEHIDLVIVRRGEKVTVEVAVHVEGQARPETVVSLDHSVLQVQAEATNIPDSIVVSVEGLAAGTQILAGQLTMPEGSSLVTDADALVVNITQQISEEALEAELAEGEEGDAGAFPAATEPAADGLAAQGPADES